MAGREALAINKVEFQGIVSAIEAEQKPASRMKLWELVEESRWAKSMLPRPLGRQTAMIKAKEMGLFLTTPKGKKGRVKGELPIRVKGVKNKKRVAAPGIQENFLKEFGPSLQATVKKACGGSLRAAVKLMCVQCSGGCKKEVAMCQVSNCPLFAFRPYKIKTK